MYATTEIQGDEAMTILDHPFKPCDCPVYGGCGGENCHHGIPACGRPLAEHRHEFKLWQPADSPYRKDYACDVCEQPESDPRHSKPESAPNSKPSLPNRAVEFLRIASKSAFTQAESEMFTEIADYLSQQQSAESDLSARVEKERWSKVFVEDAVNSGASIEDLRDYHNASLDRIKEGK